MRILCEAVTERIQVCQLAIEPVSAARPADIMDSDVNSAARPVHIISAARPVDIIMRVPLFSSAVDTRHRPVNKKETNASR